MSKELDLFTKPVNKVTSRRLSNFFVTEQIRYFMTTLVICQSTWQKSLKTTIC